MLIVQFFFLGKKEHSFGAAHHRYTLNFKKMYQRNDVHKTKRLVRRRPADLVTEQNMKEVAQKYVQEVLILLRVTVNNYIFQSFDFISTIAQIN